jgi:hypothetical protein
LDILDTPKLTIELITALGRTLAPFADAEKPQLFPWCAARFINNRRRCSALRANPACRRMAPRDPCEFLPGHFHFVLIGFFGAPGRRGQQPSRTQIDLKPGCTQWKNSAQFRSRAASPISICRDRYNFATNFWPASLVFTAINEVSRYPCAGPSRKGRGNHRGLHLPKS